MGAVSEISKAIVKAFVPGSLSFLVLGLVCGVWLLYVGTRAARVGRLWLTVLGGVYVLLGLPVVSNALLGGLQGDYGSIERATDARGARVVVVIGEGVVSHVARAGAIDQFARQTAHCVLEGARVYRLIQPSWIVASGGVPNSLSQARPESDAIRDALLGLGVARDRLLLESDSRDTAQQVNNVARLLRERQLQGPVILVTTPAHVRRVMQLAARQKIDAVPSVAGELRYDRGQTGWRRLLPSADARRGSESALYEYLALADVWLQK
jgi:uncharacterized SAM-binding protein YcdF (DUF218 family)